MDSDSVATPTPDADRQPPSTSPPPTPAAGGQAPPPPPSPQRNAAVKLVKEILYGALIFTVIAGAAGWIYFVVASLEKSGLDHFVVFALRYLAYVVFVADLYLFFKYLYETVGKSMMQQIRTMYEIALELFERVRQSGAQPVKSTKVAARLEGVHSDGD